MYSREDNERMSQEYWEANAIVTDTLGWDANRFDNREPGRDFRKLAENELLPGELSAVTVRVGCYIVRRAWRVYNVHEPGYDPELETPADEMDTALVRKNVKPDGRMILCPSWKDRLRVTQEISAKHCDSPNSGFIYICRAAESRNLRWSETIGLIYTAKASACIPDEYASLLVCLIFLGDSRTDGIWYRLDPTGKITIPGRM